MMDSPRTRKIGAAAALAVSWLALYWLVALAPLNRAILFRVGFACAALCAIGSVTFFWGVCLSYIARWRKWSPRQCHQAGISVVAPLALLCCFVEQARLLVILDWSALLMMGSGYVCGKLAHPELTDDQAYAPEPPLTLFPK